MGKIKMTKGDVSSLRSDLPCRGKIGVRRKMLLSTFHLQLSKKVRVLLEFLSQDSVASGINHQISFVVFDNSGEFLIQVKDDEYLEKAQEYLEERLQATAKSFQCFPFFQDFFEDQEPRQCAKLKSELEEL